MSNANGMIVFTATPEMAKQMKGFKSGATYVAQRATVVGIGQAAPTTRSNKKATKKVTKKVAKKVAGKPKATKATKKVTKKKVKATKRKAVKPEVILKFVRNNEGCNMTAIEGHTNLPQATIRRILNSARAEGSIRTEGQRRGLRYYAGAAPAASGGSESN